MWPRCPSPQYPTNGHMPHGQPHQQGPGGGRPCVPGCEPSRLTEDTRHRLERLGLARLSRRGRGRAVGVTLQGLWGFRVPGSASWPAPLPVPPVSCQHAVLRQRLAGAAAARASCVPPTPHKHWPGWPWRPRPATAGRFPWAIAATRVLSPGGPRGRPCTVSTPHCTPITLAGMSRGCRRRHPQRSAHWPGTPRLASGATPLLRQRVSRLVREALSCSTQRANPMGASKLFLCHYNLPRAAA